MKSSTASVTPVIVDRPRTLGRVPAARIVEREQVKQDFAREVGEALERLGLTKTEVAEGFDLDRPYLSRCLTAHEKAALSVVHVASADRSMLEVAQVIARWLCSRVALQAVDAAGVVHGDDNASRISVIATEVTDPLRVLAAALADGVLTRDELLCIRDEAREGIGALRELELEQYATQKLNEDEDNAA